MLKEQLAMIFKKSQIDPKLEECLRESNVDVENCDIICEESQGEGNHRHVLVIAHNRKDDSSTHLVFVKEDDDLKVSLNAPMIDDDLEFLRNMAKVNEARMKLATG